MDYEKKEKIVSAIVLFIFLGSIGLHYLLSPWGFYRAINAQEANMRWNLIHNAQHWLGANEADGSHRAILDIYNAQTSLPLGYTVQDTDSWCAAFVSTAAIQSGLTQIIPTECGCQRQIGLFEEIGRWDESDNAMPQPGDIIYYDWDQKNPGDATGWSDHVGIVVGVKWPFIKVIEGNKDDCVSYRIVPVGHKSIRGYGKPDYASVS